MIKGHNIICFGFAEWDNPYKTNQHHVMQRLSAANRVLFVESPGLRRPAFQKKDVTRIIRRFFRWFKGPRVVSGSMVVLSPLVIPFHGFAPVRAFNRLFLGAQVRYAAKRYGFSSPILWCYAVNAADFFGQLDEKLKVYHCVDDISANPLVPKEAVRRMEDKLLKSADVVFATSKPLYESRKDKNASTYYMPNVADFGHFNRADSPQTKEAGDLSAIPKPRIGFIGALSEYKLDFKLVHDIAKKRKDWNFVLIGPKGEGEKAADTGMFRDLKNVHLFDGRPYADIPSYLKGFDVCLLPNRMNEYTKNMFPMKFFEYLAAGKPVVSTALESLKEHGDVCYISATEEEFEKNIEKALDEKDESLKQRRMETAKLHGWDKRIEEMSEKAEKILAGRKT